MSGRSTGLFALAALLLLLAHVARAVRHSFLFARGERPTRLDLLLALSFSYVLNTLIPLRVGEIVRSVFVAVRHRLHVSHVLATVAAERLADVVVVAAISAALATSLATTAWLTAVAIGVIAAAVLVRRSARARRVVWWAASPFNDAIRLGFVEFASTASQLITGGPLWSARFVAATAGMWALYFGAYVAFAASVGLTTAQVSDALLGAPLRSLASEFFAGNVPRASVQLLAFTVAPLVVAITVGLARRRREMARVLAFVRRFGLGPADPAQSMLHERFRDRGDYAAFLRAHFSAVDEAVAAFVSEGNRHVVVHRLLPGGSDAVTAVVEEGGVICIRKVGAGHVGAKLDEQARWLRCHADALPLAPVVDERRLAAAFQYDMPYSIAARDFYDVIHTAPAEVSLRVLDDVVREVASFHDARRTGTAPNDVVDAYLERKVRRNAEEVLAYARVVLGDEFAINGAPYRLDEWNCLLDLDWLRAQLRHRDVGVIHGDLTIENIIVCPDRPRGWYIIDPNPENVLNTPLIDWAKLSQSLNLGYEALNRAGASMVRDGGIELPLLKSVGYAQLETRFATLLNERLSTDAIREVSFHEIVNYLRLTPYKIRNTPHKGATFLACTALLLRRYRTVAVG